MSDMNKLADMYPKFIQMKHEFLELKNDFVHQKHTLFLRKAYNPFYGKINNKFLGTIGDIGTYSFDHAKAITTGEGGMV